MYVPKKLKLNQFRIVQIPSAKEIITRFGYAFGSSYSGESTVPPPMSKLDAAAALDNMNDRMTRQEQMNSEYELHKNEL